MSKITNFIKDLKYFTKEMLSKDGSISSKRTAAILFVLWTMALGGFYVVKVQYGGSESDTTVSVIEFGIVTSCSLLAGGTIAEGVNSRMAKKQKESESKNVMGSENDLK